MKELASILDKRMCFTFFRTMHSSTKEPLHHNNMNNGYKILVISWSKDSQVIAVNLMENQEATRILLVDRIIYRPKSATSFSEYSANNLLPVK